MTKVNMTTDLSAPADTVWNVVRGFNALPDWHPAVAGSELSEDGGVTTRTLSLVGGGSIVERLDSADEKDRSYSYTILSGPLPVADYNGTIRVLDKGNGCAVEWSSEFNAAGVPEGDAVAVIRGIYEAGFESLKKMFGG